MEFLLVGLLIIQIAVWLKLQLSGGNKAGFFILWVLIITMGGLQQNRVDAFQQGNFNIIKTHDYFHYFISAKYFDELGYNRLYTCGIAAFQDIKSKHPDISPPQINFIRNLKSPKEFIPYAAINTENLCKQHFEKSRWIEFTEDIAVFLHEDNSADTWQQIYTDMGNNPPPSWYALTHAFANAIPFNINTLHAISYIDFIILVCIIPLIIYAGFGQLAAAGFLILLFGNALSHTSWLVGSYGRSLWLLSLVLGYCLFARGKLATASLFFAISSLLRIFPVVFIASLILFLFIDKEKRRSSYLMSAFVSAWGVVILLISYFIWGAESYTAFHDLLGVRVNMPAPPSISLSKAFLFLFSGDLDSIHTVIGLNNWLHKISDIYQRNIYGIWFFSLGIAGGFIYGLQQLKQPLFASALLGFFLMFFFMTPLTYYYMYLALILPLYSFTSNYKIEIGPFILLIITLALWSAPVIYSLGIHFIDYQISSHISLIIFLFFCFYAQLLGKKNLPENNE